jgi:hypothetical protein
MNDGLEREFDDRLLERLVDGELNDAEYRALLAELEHRPDGWRRCALAFLEDQAWGREARSARRQLDAPILQSVMGRTRWSWNFGGILTLASAASFLLAYFLATSVLQPGPARVDSNSNLAANSNQRNSGIDKASPSEAEYVAPPLGEYVMGHGGNQIAMPIFAAEDPRGRLLLNEHASMPVEMMRDLQRSGYQVNRQRQWALGEDAGDSVLVPIEELQITPVSGRSYQ